MTYIHRTFFWLPLLLLAACAPQDVAISRDNINDFLSNPSRGRPQGFRPSLFDDATEKAFRLERKADIVVELTSDGSMNIEVTERHGDEYGRNPIDFHPDQLIRFFDLQRHKNLVVVCFHKQVWPEELLKQRIEGTNQYFFDRGYQRVVIQQYRGFGRGTHSDRRNPAF